MAENPEGVISLDDDALAAAFASALAATIELGAAMQDRGLKIVDALETAGVDIPGPLKMLL